MKKAVISVFLLLPCLLFSQVKTDSIPTTVKDTVKQDTIPTGLLTDTKDEFSAIKNLFKRDKGKIQLKDHPFAARIDSLWIRELVRTNLFDSLYNEVSNLNYDEVEYNELPTDTLKARLERINQKTPFNISYNPSLESVIKNFLKRRRDLMQRVMDKSEYYFPLFEQELDNHDIPLEVKYLAIVESALNPRAKSRVGATGLWQFMFSTGRLYGLDVNSYVDERMDPIKSTVAAGKYLAKLYEIFGDWDLALAAYNSGPGNVSKAIRRSGGYKNYWNLRPFLPRETAGYVPAFLATMYIFEYAEEHGFKTKKREVTYFETDTIKVKSLITFDQISELTGVDREEVEFFNPSYKLDIIPFIKEKEYSLRLSREALGKFVANEDSIYSYVAAELSKREKPLPELVKVNSRIRYRVRSGDYLGKIANRYGVRVSDIKRWNGLRNNNLRIGQRLTIYPRKPGFSAKPKKKSTPQKTTEKVSNTTNSKTYTVRSGDSLWTISQKFPGISVQNLKDWNDISGNNLKPGMQLKLCNC
ncbi:LysM peptidoglycan-binding domain-containing protein [Leptobacterium flavescens]|uniref:LysM peptidoglycan-binding domain-containing protein n=1 Tax=Leptobacterium flavescens TaxID=472055 RepID=A0A6P0UN11_9FLAO|nr:LysM peptidoglycan-binding domain-containing protein [Leptobacterium flavescens]NER13268.1 LysM peptidoglycan-binding domain-containing protein [Leptobacterium flavescens]